MGVLMQKPKRIIGFEISAEDNEAATLLYKFLTGLVTDNVKKNGVRITDVGSTGLIQKLPSREGLIKIIFEVDPQSP